MSSSETLLSTELFFQPAPTTSYQITAGGQNRGVTSLSFRKMSARPVVKTSTMNGVMQEAAIMAAQDAIANFTTEQEIASAIKQKFEQQFPSTCVPPPAIEAC